jgi:hypothetical protein
MPVTPLLPRKKFTHCLTLLTLRVVVHRLAQSLTVRGALTVSATVLTLLARTIRRFSRLLGLLVVGDSQRLEGDNLTLDGWDHRLKLEIVWRARPQDSGEKIRDRREDRENRSENGKAELHLFCLEAGKTGEQRCVPIGRDHSRFELRQLYIGECFDLLAGLGQQLLALRRFR